MVSWFVKLLKPSKMHILWCVCSKFCAKFQRASLKSHTKFWTHTSQNVHLTDFDIYDILELWRHKPQTPFTQGCDHCTSLVRPQNWPGRCWSHKGGRKVALVVQGWHRGPRNGRHGRRKVLSVFKTVAQGSPRRSVAHWSLKGGRGRHARHRGRRMDAQGSAIGRPVKMRTVVNIVYQFERCFCLPCTAIAPPLADKKRPLSDLCGDPRTSIRRPRQPLSYHGNGSASTLPPLRDLLCHYNSFGDAAVTQKQDFVGWASWSFFWSLKGGTQVAALCKGTIPRWNLCTGRQ